MIVRLLTILCVIKNVLEDLFVLHVSQLEKMIKSSFFFQKMRRRKLYKNCINKFILENKKVFQTFFYYGEKSYYHVGFLFRVWEKPLTQFL